MPTHSDFIRLGRRLIDLQDWLPYARGIIYLVNSNEVERIHEAKEALDYYFCRGDLARIPVVILGNKIDDPAAISEEELKRRLGVHQTTGKVRPSVLDCG